MQAVFRHSARSSGKIWGETVIGFSSGALVVSTRESAGSGVSVKPAAEIGPSLTLCVASERSDGIDRRAAASNPSTSVTSSANFAGIRSVPNSFQESLAFGSKARAAWNASAM